MLRSLEMLGLGISGVQLECQNHSTNLSAGLLRRKFLLPSCVNDHIGNAGKHEVLFLEGGC